MIDFEAMFKMKQDDWLAACKEIDDLRAQLAERDATITKLLEESAENIFDRIADAEKNYDSLPHVKLNAEIDIPRSKASQLESTLKETMRMRDNLQFRHDRLRSYFEKLVKMVPYNLYKPDYLIEVEDILAKDKADEASDRTTGKGE